MKMRKNTKNEKNTKYEKKSSKNNYDNNIYTKIGMSGQICKPSNDKQETSNLWSVFFRTKMLSTNSQDDLSGHQNITIQNNINIVDITIYIKSHTTAVTITI